MRPLTKGHGMRGTMLWFNGDKDLGVIETPEGERYPVQGAEFKPERPGLRCRGTAVEFEVAGDEEPVATAVRMLTEDAPRRARRRHGRSY
jgi:cold shock CspA family protein